MMDENKGMPLSEEPENQTQPEGVTAGEPEQELPDTQVEDSPEESPVEAPDEAGQEDAEAMEGSTLFAAPRTQRPVRKKKNKNLRNLIAGVIALCVLVGALFGLKWILPEKEDDEGNTSSASDTISLKKTDVNKLKSVEVKTSAAAYKAVSKQEKSSSDSSAEPAVTWMLEGYDQALMDESSILSLASTYAEITAIREMETGDRALSDFGLEKPSISVTVTEQNGSVYKVLLGDESPTADGVYLMLDGSDKVYLSSLSFKTEAEKTPLDFASTVIVTAMADTTDNSSESGKIDPYFSNGTLIRYDRINLGGTIRSQEIRLTYDDSNSVGMSPYKVISPRKTDADSEKVGSTLLAPMASGLSGDSVYELNPTAAKIKEYGLDKPLSTVFYEIKSTKLTLSIAGAPDSGYYAVMVTGKPVIFKVAKSTIPFAEWQGPDIYASLIFLADIHTVEKIVVEKDGKTHTFEIDIAKDNESDPDSSSVSVSAVRADGKSMDIDDFKDLYQVIIGLTATEYTDDPKPAGNPQFKLTFVYRDTAKNPSVLTFTKMTERRYWYEVEGAGNILISSQKYNDVVNGVMKYFQ